MAAPNPDQSSGEYDIIVVGAGIAGLMASGYLIKAGYRVAVLEKARGVGGRMATRRIGEAVCDHGAQYFSVKGRYIPSVVFINDRITCNIVQTNENDRVFSKSRR